MTSDALTLGSFLLTDPSGSAWKAGVEAEGTSRGAPVPIEQAINTFLQDGSIVITQGYDNREVNIRVRMWATSLTALSSAEAALFAELGHPNLLTWTPTSGPAAVFRVVTSSMVHDDTTGNADLLASQRLIRSYNVRLLCEAFTASATEVVTAALPATGVTTTVLDACAATTGWTGFIDGGAVSPSTSGGSVLVTGTVTAGKHTFSLQKTFAATTTSTKFLAVDSLRPAGATTDPTAGQGVFATGDGVSLPLLAEIPSATSGYVRSYFQVAASSLAVTRVDFVGATPAGSKSFSITEVDVTNVNPIVGTGRQQARSLVITGSARAQGSLAIESATAALGDGTLVYVYPRDASTSGYSPSLRQFRLSGAAVTPNAAMVSGSSEPLGPGVGPTIFTVPIGLFPRGSYLLLGRLATSGGGTPTITYQYATNYAGTAVDVSQAAGRAITTTTAYQTFTIARLLLPSVDLDPTATSAGAVMWLAVNSTTGCTYDEFWLFNTTIGQLIQVDCGTGAGAAGGSSRRLFIEPATVTTPRPTIRVGHSADRSDSHYPVSISGGVTTISNVQSWQSPEFRPPQVNVFTVTPNATDTTVALRHFPRWHTNPAS